MNFTSLQNLEQKHAELKTKVYKTAYGMKEKTEIKTVQFLGNVWGCPKVVS